MITGAVVSLNTVTVKLHPLLLPQSSVPVQVIVKMPRPNRVPEGGEQLTVTLVSQSSVAVGGIKNTGILVEHVHSV